MSRCTHPTMDSHKKGALWVCSGCSTEFKWSGEACYFGNMECLKCGRASIYKVFCSTLCRAFGGDPKDWRDYGKADLGEAAAGAGLPPLASSDEPDAAPRRLASAPTRRREKSERTVCVRLTEAELMEIMADLVEASKGKFCDAERSARIWAVIEKKIDPAVRTLRLG